MARHGTLVLALLFAVGCGVKPAPFTEKAKPLASSLKVAVEKRNKAEIDRIVAKAEQYRQSKVFGESELKIVKTVQEYANKDEWDKAQKLIDDSLSYH